MRLVGRLLVLFRLLGRLPRPRFRSPQVHPWPLAGRSVFIGLREFIVRDSGLGDGPPVVLVHGLGGSSLAEWYEVGPRLAGHRRVVLVDHRNHGFGPADTERYEIGDLADDLVAVLDEVGISDFDIVGYSMGGAIAQAVARRTPSRVRRLVLVGTFANHPTAWRIARQVGTIVLRAWERLTGFGTPQTRAGYLILTGAVEHRHAEWMWDEVHRRTIDGGAEASLALFRFDSRPWLSELTMPTLVVVPTKDQLVPVRWQYRLAGLLPSATVVDIAGGRHEVPWTHADRLTDEIEDFLGKEE